MSADRPLGGTLPATPPRRARGRRCRTAAVAFLSSAALAAVAAALLAAPSPSAAPQGAAQPHQNATFPNGGYFVVTCGFSHMNNDDPIVFPGEPGRSHNHTYIGNRTVTALSTPATLLGAQTTCDPPADASAYWMPTVYSTRAPVIPLAAIVYYVKRTQARVAPFPAGLKMVAGRADARTRQPKGVVAWSCDGIGAPPRSSAPRNCASDRFLQLQVTFPNCWDGASLDGADHRSHLVYSTRGRCRASHPVALPTMVLIVLYPPVRAAQVASGRLGGHADFMNGWEPAALERLVAGLNASQR